MTPLKMGEHISERNFEEYCLSRVRGTDLEELEDHLLVCSQCQIRLHETDFYVRTMRQAMVELAREEAARGDHGFFNLARKILLRMGGPLPMGGLVAVSALALLLGVGPLLSTYSKGWPVTVSLESARGGDAELTARAPERTPLALSLDLTGLPLEASYQVRLVDAKGTQVLEAVSRPTKGRLVVSLHSRLRRGSYWVRLYDRNDPRTALREYGLRLQ
jgi:hypothetical protein